MKTVLIKTEKAKILSLRHPWIFSKAFKPLPNDLEDGEICKIAVEGEKQHFGYAFVNQKSDILSRMIAYQEEDLSTDFLRNRLISAFAEKKELVPESVSNGFRLINAEGDFLPGLVIDIYNDCAVIQISTKGMDNLKSEIVSVLENDLKIHYIVEKSQAPSRKHEGLVEKSFAWLSALKKESEFIPVHEHGLNYLVPIESGQKTGFFLDQRQMRLFLREISNGKKVLNTCAYSGGFSVNALKGGATKVVSVDSSRNACQMIDKHIEINNLDNSKHKTHNEDVFEFLKNTTDTFDIIVLDPPAFVKRLKDLPKGFKHYLELNELGLKKLNNGGILITFSCSPFMPEVEFQKMLFYASSNLKKDMRIITKHRHGLDHPVSIFHPEGSYLKGFVLKELVKAPL